MKDYLKHVSQIIKPYYFQEIAGLFFTILYGVTLVGTPLASKYLIDNVLPADTYQKVFIGLGFFFLICILQPVFNYLKNRIIIKVMEKITFDIRNVLFQKVINAYFGFFDNTKRGMIISRIANDGAVVGQLISDFFVVLLSNMLFIGMIFIGMLYLSVKISLSIAGSLIVFVLLNIYLAKKYNHISEKIYKNTDNLYTIIEQITASIASIKSFLMESIITKKFKEILKGCQDDNMTASHLGNLIHATSRMIMVISICIIYGFGALSVMNGEMTLGSIIALGLYFQLMIPHLFELVNKHVDIKKSIIVFDRIKEYRSLPSENIGNGKNVQKLAGDVIINNLSFSYDNKKSVLRNVSFHIKNGEWVVIEGKSGSGKSTLAKILLGFYQPTGGEVLIAGIPMDEISIETLRSNFGYVSQDIDLFPMSVIENLRCGRRDASQEEIIDICSKLGIHNKIMNLPDGYQSILTERINLSGGEKQRIAIARALLKKPSILILDEPTSSLDPENERKTLAVLSEYNIDCSLIVITHKEKIIDKADSIITIEQGNIIGNRYRRPVK